MKRIGTGYIERCLTESTRSVEQCSSNRELDGRSRLSADPKFVNFSCGIILTKRVSKSSVGETLSACTSFDPIRRLFKDCWSLRRNGPSLSSDVRLHTAFNEEIKPSRHSRSQPSYHHLPSKSIKVSSSERLLLPGGGMKPKPVVNWNEMGSFDDHHK
ncbi:mu-adaptin 3 [Pseudozyma hubeiensis SY62]|uniref:Mu-adaptin 3 n=1 Tax=Pseudozyma hubeiensis (strain SY62) TaxID=1305764 RepID=R9P384_PSEHS|nr:mu-adaptin 3 [Pseudozyma hubeiensis SY62]GAC95717.1 mu-adaptin 3 [Pseudozyma hubeiensis SY62]